MCYTATYDSPVGVLTLAADRKGLVGLWMEGQKYFAGTVKEPMVVLPEAVEGEPSGISRCREVLEAAEAWLDRYFAGKKPSPDELPLAPRGNAFRQSVWSILCAIPYGQVTTYGAIAREIARKRGVARFSSQAVGGAVGHNPISIIIPCHRVVGANGRLTGYAGGIDRKRKLLAGEGVDVSRFAGKTRS